MTQLRPPVAGTGGPIQEPDPHVPQGEIGAPPLSYKQQTFLGCNSFHSPPSLDNVPPAKTASTRRKMVRPRDPSAAPNAGQVDPTTLPVLDHNFYPHLFDLIVDHAPVKSLIRLRGTCKDLCNRIDGIFMNSLVIHGHPTFQKDKSVETHLGRAPLLFWVDHEGMFVTSRRQSPQGKLAKKRVMAAVAGVKVVDVIGKLPEWCVPLLEHIPAELDVARYFINQPNVGEQAQDKVLAQLPARKTIMFCSFDTSEDVPYLEIAQVGYKSGKVIVNVDVENSIDDLPLAATAYPEMPWNQNINELVIRFALPEPTVGAHPVWSKRRPSRLGIFEVIADALVDQLPVIEKMVLVDITALDPLLLGFRTPVTPEQLQDRIVDKLKAKAAVYRDVWGHVHHAGWTTQMLKSAVDNIQFMTSQEYEATLPPNELYLEIEPAPPSTHHPISVRE